MTIRKRFLSKKHEDDERYDEVQVKCNERWKESGLSGDEWWFSYTATFFRKGCLFVKLLDIPSHGPAHPGAAPVLPALYLPGMFSTEESSGK